MPTTPNLGLVNVLEGENFDIDVYNGNNDKVDTFAGTIPQKSVLFENANGTNSTVALNDSSANYSYVEITYTDNENLATSSVSAKNGEKAQLSTFHAFSGNKLGAKIADVLVSGTTISFVSNTEVQVPSGTGLNNPIKITKVVGVKGF